MTRQDNKTTKLARRQLQDNHKTRQQQKKTYQSQEKAITLTLTRQDKTRQDKTRQNCTTNKDQTRSDTHDRTTEQGKPEQHTKKEQENRRGSQHQTKNKDIQTVIKKYCQNVRHII